MFSVIFHYNTWRENQEKTTKGAFKIISASSTLSRGCVSSYLCADTQGPALALFLPFLSWFCNDNTCLLVLGGHSKYSNNELADSLSDSLPPQQLIHPFLYFIYLYFLLHNLLFSSFSCSPSSLFFFYSLCMAAHPIPLLPSY